MVVPVTIWIVSVAPVATQLAVCSFLANTSSVTESPLTAPFTTRVPVVTALAHDSEMLAIVCWPLLVDDVVVVAAVKGALSLVVVVSAVGAN